MSMDELEEKCPNLLKTAKDQSIYHIEECCWGSDWKKKFKAGFISLPVQITWVEIAHTVIT